MSSKKIAHWFGSLAISVLVACSGGGGGDGGATIIPEGNQKLFVRWHTIAIDASGRDHTKDGGREQLGPVRAARAMAIVHVALGDVGAAISGRYHSFLPIAQSPNADLQIALAQAAHDTLVTLYKSQRSIFDAALAEDLAAVPEGAAKDAGIALGKKAAQNAIDFCRNDGSEKSEPYVVPHYSFSNEPGKWRKDPLNPDQNVLGANWSIVRPFVLDSSAQFRIPPPPALDSPEYAAAFNETKAVGGDGVVTPTSRTDEQSVIGVYWAYDGTPSLCAPTRFYNQIGVQIGLQQQLDVFDLIRLLALMNISMMDAGSVSWESKYFYNYWRPVTAIREADAGTGPTGRGDGNPATVGDPTFTPLGAPASNLAGRDFTPPFPSYPSGHGTFGGAIFETLRNFFGTDDIPFTMVSDEFNGQTMDENGNVRPLLPRSFNNLTEAEEENAISRIYLGIHFRFDATNAIILGQQVGDYVFQRAYQPIVGTK